MKRVVPVRVKVHRTQSDGSLGIVLVTILQQVTKQERTSNPPNPCLTPLVRILVLSASITRFSITMGMSGFTMKVFVVSYFMLPNEDFEL